METYNMPYDILKEALESSELIGQNAVGPVYGTNQPQYSQPQYSQLQYNQPQYSQPNLQGNVQPVQSVVNGQTHGQPNPPTTEMAMLQELKGIRGEIRQLKQVMQLRREIELKTDKLIVPVQFVTDKWDSEEPSKTEEKKDSKKRKHETTEPKKPEKKKTDHGRGHYGKVMKK